MSDDKKKLDFDGLGFDKSEFTEQERAQHRQMRKHYESNFLEPKEFLQETGLAGLVSLIKAATPLVRIITVMAIIGGAASWAAQRGLF